MLDKADDARTRATHTGPRLDFQDHLADLEAAGLVERIDTPINKDTELHPLVRWQFRGGIPESERKAFLFERVVDQTGRRFENPVVVGALAARAARRRKFRSLNGASVATTIMIEPSASPRSSASFR